MLRCQTLLGGVYPYDPCRELVALIDNIMGMREVAFC